jgi:hypothetical protein
MFLFLFQIGAHVVRQKSVRDVVSVKEIEGASYRVQSIACDDRNHSERNFLINESLHVFGDSLYTQLPACINPLRLIGIERDPDAIKKTSFSEERKHIPTEDGEIGLNGVGYNNIGTKNRNLQTANFPKEARFEKQWFATVPNKFNGFDTVFDGMSENVQKHFLDLVEIHSLLLMKIFKFITVTASQVAVF